MLNNLNTSWQKSSSYDKDNLKWNLFWITHASSIITLIKIKSWHVLTTTCEEWSLNSHGPQRRECDVMRETRAYRNSWTDHEGSGDASVLTTIDILGWLARPLCTLWVWHYIMIIHGVTVFYYRHWFRTRCTRDGRLTWHTRPVSH